MNSDIDAKKCYYYTFNNNFRIYDIITDFVFSPTESPNRVIFESIPVIIVIFLPTLAVITTTIYSSIKKHFTALDAYCYGITHIL